MNLNLGLENLNQCDDTVEQSVSLEAMTADALDVMYIVFGNTNRDLLDRFVAKATGNSYEALHSLSLMQIQEALMNKMMQESNEGLTTYTSMQKKLVKAERMIQALQESYFKTKKLGVKLPLAKDLMAAMSTAHKLCFQTMSVSITDEIKITKDTTSAEISAQCEKLKNKISKMVEDANEITDQLELSRLADQTAAEAGYTKSTCLKICSDFININ